MIIIVILSLFQSFSIIAEGEASRTYSYDIKISDDWAGPPEMYEDEGPYIVLLSGPEGMINDTVGNITLIEMSDGDGHFSNITSNQVFKMTIHNVDGNWTGTIDLYKDRSGNESIRFHVTTEVSSEIIEVLFPVTPVNDMPQIIIHSTTSRSWSQHSNVSIRPRVIDPDKDDEHSFSVNMRVKVSPRYSSVITQLKYYDPKQGIDWDINSTTGYFWWRIDDRTIWRTANGMVDSVDVTLEFKVTDKMGEFSLVIAILTLQSMSDGLDSPDKIMSDPPSYEDIFVGDEILFWVDPVPNPFDYNMTYIWDLGYGIVKYGREIKHTFETVGWRTVQMWVEDGIYASEWIAYRFEVRERNDGPYQQDGDLDGDGVKNIYDDFWDDPAASEDSDNDGYPDEWNPGMTRKNSTTGLRLDKYPDDPDRDGYESEGPTFIIWSWLVMVFIAIISMVFIALYLMKKGDDKGPEADCS